MKGKAQGSVPDLTADRHSVAVHYLRLLVEFVSVRGLPVAQLLQQAGIAADSLFDPNGRVPYLGFNCMCELAAEQLREPCLGLKLGMSIQPGHLGSHGFALMSCSNGEELIRQHSRYSALTIDAAHSAFELHNDEYVRYWRSNLPGGAALGRLQDELNQASVIVLSRWFTNRQDLAPNWVSFRHSRPADISVYEDLFRCPVHFGAAETGLGFKAEYARLPLPHANAHLRRVMDDLCAQLIKQLGNSLEPAWMAVARRAVLDSFKSGEPDVKAVAHAAGMSEAELKDQLGERGFSFRSFIDDLRRGLALGYARDPSLGLVDIAYLLGFSEQSAFQRAFKRWTGTTPGEYRRNQPARPV